jgi:HD-GYP domain-containing protein (c-di-GMP phosphodiesterase class II)
MDGVKKAHVLLVGIEEQVLEILDSVSKQIEFSVIKTSADFEQKFESWQDGHFAAIFCGREITEMSEMEIAQVIQNQCPETPKYFVTFKTEKFEPRNLLKNGFSGVFSLPVDRGVFKKTIDEKILSEGLQQKVFKPVRVLDIKEDSKLDFDTFLFFPLNKKYVKYSKADQVIEKSKVEKLSSHQMNSIFLDHADMGKFYKYSADRLRALGQEGGSSTEKRERLNEAVRALLMDFFDQSIKSDLSEGKEMKENCDKIISNYVTKGATSDWYQQLTSSMSMGEDTYDRASSVATFAALFGIGLGHKAPEDLALAGLFHDVGLAQIPPEILEKPQDKWSKEERETYYTHPEKSVFIVKSRRLIIPAIVEKAILQHHEGFHGRGFPKQVSGDRICEEAQILSFAIQFDEETRIKSGQAQVDPQQAIEKIKSTGSINPEIVSRIKTLLESKKPAATSKGA